MGLKDIIITVSILALVVSGLIVFISGFIPISSDEKYNSFMKPVSEDLSSFNNQTPKNITQELEQASSEAVTQDSNEISMIKAGYKILKTALNMPELVLKLLNSMQSALGLPAWLIGGLLSIFLIILAFAVFEIIRGQTM